MEPKDTRTTDQKAKDATSVGANGRRRTEAETSRWGK